MTDDVRCPCGTGSTYERCCGRLHRGEAQAVTAEQLMRSRYSAFARGDVGYLAHSWHPTTRPRRIRLDAVRLWTGLDIVDNLKGGMLDQEGVVEFRASHRTGEQTGELRERSRFVRHEGRWVYLGLDG